MNTRNKTENMTVNPEVRGHSLPLYLGTQRTDGGSPLMLKCFPSNCAHCSSLKSLCPRGHGSVLHERNFILRPTQKRPPFLGLRTAQNHDVSTYTDIQHNISGSRCLLYSHKLNSEFIRKIRNRVCIVFYCVSCMFCVMCVCEISLRFIAVSGRAACSSSTGSGTNTVRTPRTPLTVNRFHIHLFIHTHPMPAILHKQTKGIIYTVFVYASTCTTLILERCCV